jgi:hypothetical protein
MALTPFQGTRTEGRWEMVKLCSDWTKSFIKNFHWVKFWLGQVAGLSTPQKAEFEMATIIKRVCPSARFYFSSSSTLFNSPFTLSYITMSETFLFTSESVGEGHPGK